MSEEATINTTMVDGNLFEKPVCRIDVSGGTAPFFILKCLDPNKEKDRYIGKDLSRATDEIEFYEKLIKLQKRTDNTIQKTHLKELMNFSFEYLGVLTAPEAGVPDNPDLELLVLQNLYGGLHKLRLLDLKIGTQTASANWKKKSRLRAAKQHVFDHFTNSVKEGFRLEGFDGAPKSISSRDETIKQENASMLNMKKAKRLLFQNYDSFQVFDFFTDLQVDYPKDYSLGFYFSTEEVVEIVLNAILIRLVKLAIICHKVSIPQKWVGSSVALGYDCGHIPKRASNAEQHIRSSVIVNIFDWGRSELNTPEDHELLTKEEKEDRHQFWEFYTMGIDHLSYAAVQTYYNRFGNTSKWEKLVISLYDFDTNTKDDFLGKVTVPIQPTELLNHKIVDGKGTLTFSVEWRPYPRGSRFVGTWRVFIKEAKDIQKADLLSASDAYCVITAISSDNSYRSRQMSSVVPDSCVPVWNEEFEIPVMKPQYELKHTLDKCGIKLTKHLELALRGKGDSKASIIKSSFSESSHKTWRKSLVEGEI